MSTSTQIVESAYENTFALLNGGIPFFLMFAGLALGSLVLGLLISGLHRGVKRGLR